MTSAMDREPGAELPEPQLPKLRELTKEEKKFVRSARLAMNGGAPEDLAREKLLASLAKSWQRILDSDEAPSIALLESTIGALEQCAREARRRPMSESRMTSAMAEGGEAQPGFASVLERCPLHDDCQERGRSTRRSAITSR